MYDEIRSLFEGGDSYQAMERIQVGDPLAVAERYSTLVNDLYWKAKDLQAVVVVARAGILYCLTRATDAGSREEDEKLRGTAKQIAYNLGSYTWPGWDEPGIEIGPAELAAGLDAARCNLRLAVELRRGARPMGNAHWLLGAHLLAAGRNDEALQEFTRAQEAAGEDTDQAAAGMRSGYVALARMLLDPDADRRGFEEALSCLETIGSDDARGYIEQLQTARRVFTDSPSPVS